MRTRRWLLAFSWLVSAWASAATFTVTRVDDPTPDGCAASDCSLREAVSLANALPGPDVVLLPASAAAYQLARPGANEDAAASGDLDVSDTLRIVGSGDTPVAVVQTVADRLLHVIAQQAPLVLENLALHGGQGVLRGGAIASASQVTLRGCTFSGNSASDYGGAIAATFTSLDTTTLALDVADSSFSGNEAASGGAIALLASINGSVNVRIERSTFNANVALDAGGAIGYNPEFAHLSTLIVRDSDFQANEATGQTAQGGAIGLPDQVPTHVSATIQGSRFDGNRAEGNAARGGAVAGVRTIVRSRFQNNVGRTGGAVAGRSQTIEDSQFCDNQAYADGGAISALSIDVSRSTFCRNSAGANGGALAIAGATRIERSTFDANVAQLAGGAIAQGDGDLSVRQSTLVAPDMPPAGLIGTLLRYEGADDADDLVLFGSLMRGRCSFAADAGVIDSAFYTVGTGGDTCGLGQAGPLFGGNTVFASAGSLPLDALADNGGPTLTRMPTATQPANPALDRVPPATCIDPDQRYFTRTDGSCDAGAVEASGVPCRWGFFQMVSKADHSRTPSRRVGRLTRRRA
jgi:CSLREA domain-containing protein